jgi:hypothetical protein
MILISIAVYLINVFVDARYGIVGIKERTKTPIAMHDVEEDDSNSQRVKTKKLTVTTSHELRECRDRCQRYLPYA